MRSKKINQWKKKSALTLAAISTKKRLKYLTHQATCTSKLSSWGCAVNALACLAQMTRCTLLKVPAWPHPPVAWQLKYPLKCCLNFETWHLYLSKPWSYSEQLIEWNRTAVPLTQIHLQHVADERNPLFSLPRHTNAPTVGHKRNQCSHYPDTHYQDAPTHVQ